MKKKLIFILFMSIIFFNFLVVFPGQAERLLPDARIIRTNTIVYIWGSDRDGEAVPFYEGERLLIDNRLIVTFTTFNLDPITIYIRLFDNKSLVLIENETVIQYDNLIEKDDPLNFQASGLFDYELFLPIANDWMFLEIEIGSEVFSFEYKTNFLAIRKEYSNLDVTSFFIAGALITLLSVLSTTSFSKAYMKKAKYIPQLSKDRMIIVLVLLGLFFAMFFMVNIFLLQDTGNLLLFLVTILAYLNFCIFWIFCYKFSLDDDELSKFLLLQDGYDTANDDMSLNTEIIYTIKHKAENNNAYYEINPRSVIEFFLRGVGKYIPFTLPDGTWGRKDYGLGTDKTEIKKLKRNFGNFDKSFDIVSTTVPKIEFYLDITKKHIISLLFFSVALFALLFDFTFAFVLALFGFLTAMLFLFHANVIEREIEVQKRLVTKEKSKVVKDGKIVEKIAKRNYLLEREKEQLEIDAHFKHREETGAKAIEFFLSMLGYYFQDTLQKDLPDALKALEKIKKHKEQTKKELDDLEEQPEGDKPKETNINNAGKKVKGYFQNRKKKEEKNEQQES